MLTQIGTRTQVFGSFAVDLNCLQRLMLIMELSQYRETGARGDLPSFCGKWCPASLGRGPQVKLPSMRGISSQMVPSMSQLRRKTIVWLSDSNDNDTVYCTCYMPGTLLHAPSHWIPMIILSGCLCLLFTDVNSVPGPQRQSEKKRSTTPEGMWLPAGLEHSSVYLFSLNGLS